MPILPTIPASALKRLFQGLFPSPGQGRSTQQQHPFGIALTPHQVYTGETWRAMRFNLLLALAITYFLMAGLFESWLYPFVIILSVPQAAGGALPGCG